MIDLNKEYWIHKAFLKEDKTLPKKKNYINFSEHLKELAIDESKLQVLEESELRIVADEELQVNIDEKVSLNLNQTIDGNKYFVQNVGIGDDSFANTLSVKKNITGSNRINIINEHVTGYQTIRFTDNTGAAAAIYKDPSDRLVVQNAKAGGTIAIQTTNDNNSTGNAIFIDKDRMVNITTAMQLNTKLVTGIDVVVQNNDDKLITSKGVFDYTEGYIKTYVDDKEQTTKTYVDDEINSISILYTNAEAVPSNVGGVETGDTFSAVSYEDMFTRILYPYQYPAFTSFTLTNFNASRYEVGTSISGNQPFTWSTSNNININVNAVQINGDNITTVTGLSNDSNESITFNTSLTRTSAGIESWTIQLTNTKNQNVTRNKNIRWDFRQYYGSSTNTSLTEAQIKNLQSNRLTPSNITGSYSFPSIGYKYFVFADDNSYTKPSSFQDTDTGFAVGIYSGYNNTQNGYSYDLVSITSSTGVTNDYRVYRTSNQLSAAINVQIN
jgi:hypothetical protein